MASLHAEGRRGLIISIENCKAEALARLATNEVIAVPGPRPFPYVICAASPQIVNDAKGRQSSQSVIAMLDDLESIRRYVFLDDRLFEFANFLAHDEKLHLLLPHSSDLPDIYKGAARDGYLGVSMAWHDGLLFMLEQGNLIFASSANSSGKEPLTSAAEVDALFGGQHLVVMDPAHDGLNGHSGGIVRFNADSSIELSRPGFQISESGLDSKGYELRLQERALEFVAFGSNR